MSVVKVRPEGGGRCDDGRPLVAEPPIDRGVLVGPGHEAGLTRVGPVAEVAGNGVHHPEAGQLGYIAGRANYVASTVAVGRPCRYYHNDKPASIQNQQWKVADARVLHAAGRRSVKV